MQVFFNKKIKTQVNDDSNEDKTINFTWVLLMGMKFGFTKKQVDHMYFGEWSDFFEMYKTIHDFEMNQRYTPLKNNENEQTGSLMDL